jgi:L,D-peptidoglycan transpeptidase YkuD (ErfK/YbiS/YcfS/YnhG family)
MTGVRVISHTELRFQSKFFRCTIGSAGFTNDHKEGDKKTPVGKFRMRECWYRADRIAAPQTGLPLKIITPTDGWCDDPKHTSYNRHVQLPFAASHENLWRDDLIYDIIVPIGFNDDPVIPGKGSAIFFHLAKPNYTHTLGCVAVIMPDMLEILKECTPDSYLSIEPEMKFAKLYVTE